MTKSVASAKCIDLITPPAYHTPPPPKKKQKAKNKKLKTKTEEVKKKHISSQTLIYG